MAFRAGTTSALYITTAGGSLSNVSPWADSASTDLSANQLDVSAFGTQAQAFINGQTTGNISLGGPLDAPMHTILAGLYASGSSSPFIYGPGGSVATQARFAGTFNVASYNVSSSASGRVEYSATLQITGALAAGTF
jgi:hypothetical protein